MALTRVVEAFDALVPDILTLTKAPGMSIALGVDDEVVWAKGYGYAELASQRAGHGSRIL